MNEMYALVCIQTRLHFHLRVCVLMLEARVVFSIHYLNTCPDSGKVVVRNFLFTFFAVMTECRSVTIIIGLQLNRELRALC